MILYSKNNIFKKFFSNTSWLVAQNIYQMLLSLVIGSISARYLGPDNYGLINYGISIVTLFSSLSSLGLEYIVVNEIIKENNCVEEVIGSSITLRLLASVLSIFLINFLVIIIEPDSKLLHLIVFLQSLSLVFRSAEVINYWFQVNLISKYHVIASSIVSTVIGIWKIYLLSSGASVTFFAISVTIEAVLLSIVYSALFYKKFNHNYKCSLLCMKKILYQSKHYIISGIAVTLYTQLDKIMIGKYFSSKGVGLYTAASTTSSMWFFIFFAIINSARPIILELKSKNNNSYVVRLKQLYGLIVYSAIVICFVITIFSKLIIFILYGSDYIDAQISLIILTWSGIFVLLSTARNIWLVAEDLIQYPKFFTILGAATNILLNTILIPILGVNGASIATFISQFTVCIIAPLVFKKTRKSTFIILQSLNIENLLRELK